MCGICGFIDFSFQRESESVLYNMVRSLNHRGPDDNGIELVLSDLTAIGFGHSRLSILDLSDAGHQPMKFNDLILVLNGEIYNFLEIRKELEKLGHVFKSDSDTEVVLHAFSEWHTGSISRFIGMFAFAVYDTKTKVVIIVRDRAGVKPLFYFWQNGLFMFASEMKAFHQHSRFQKKLNKIALHQFLDFGYIPSPNSIFENCFKLEPGHYLTFDINHKTISITKYWDVHDYYCLPELKISYNEAINEVEKLLISAFKYRMIADVPVGVFLSGGYDSTAVTSLLQRNMTEKLKTFTIGFEEGNNEAPFAEKIANYLGTDHTELYCKTKEAQLIIPSIPYYYDEPFADSSAIPTILVSSLARKNVKVALSADAGDEIFAGYSNYRTFLQNLSIINNIPTQLRKVIGSLGSLGTYVLPESFFRHKLNVLSGLLIHDHSHIPQKLLKEYYTLDNTIKKRLLLEEPEPYVTIYDNDFSKFKDNLSIALATDYTLYLQNDILTKVDRASMSVSLESREPFLDHRLVEFAAQLPSSYKYGKIQKMILKDIVQKYVPENLLDRPKSGFSPPVFDWLKKDLLFLLEENLNPKMIAQTGLFNPFYVSKLKKSFLKGQLYDPIIIWKLLQFQMWFRMWMS